MSSPGPPELSPSKRAAIVALHDQGLSYQAIANKYGIAKSTAHYTYQRYQEHGTYKSLPRSGRPPIVTDRTRRHVLRDIKNNRTAPYADIAKSIEGVTARQVRDIATAAGYHRRVARRKPYLTPAQIEKRMAWAEANRERDWGKVIFTDETRLEIGERPGRRYVTRKPGEEFLFENIQPTFKSGRKSIMVWGCIAAGKKGPLVRLRLGQEVDEEPEGRRRKSGRGGLDGPRYIKQVLNGPLKRFYAEMVAERGSGIVVVEDGAPAHSCNLAKAARASLGIRTLTHPPNSPDLNPIEPVWNLFKNRVADIPESRENIDKLWAAAKRVWEELTVEEIWHVAGSMSERVDAVLAAKGLHTRF